jgi:hypothetical protein
MEGVYSYQPVKRRPYHLHTHTRAHTHTHIHARTRTHAHAHTNTHAHTHTHTHTHAQTHTRAHTHTHTHTCTRAHTHTQSHARTHTLKTTDGDLAATAAELTKTKKLAEDTETLAGVCGGTVCLLITMNNRNSIWSPSLRKQPSLGKESSMLIRCRIEYIKQFCS